MSNASTDVFFDVLTLAGRGWALWPLAACPTRESCGWDR